MNIKHRLTIGMFSLLLATQLAAQWQTLDDEGSDHTIRVAVDNPDGYRLSIQRSQDNTVRGIFELRSGFDEFPDDGCPTFRIDKRQPINLFMHSRSCIANGNRVVFTLGDIADNRIKSVVLMQLMDGNSLLLRFPLKDVGYRETGFTLSRSKQALGSVLGDDVTVEIQ